jgi:ribosome-binding ATPase
MSLKVGIVGLPNVGKSTLFNALLKKQQALAANYPFATIEPNIGVVPVPDKRLEQLAITIAKGRERGSVSDLTSEVDWDKTPSNSHLVRGRGIESEPYSIDLGNERDTYTNLPPIVPATVEFYDIAGLVKGASEGEGLGNKFLAHIRECALMCLVVRAFSSSEVVLTGSGEVKTDKETILTELILADMNTVENKIRNSKFEIRNNVSMSHILNKLQKGLDEGRGAREILSEEELGEVHDLFLLTAKPILYVINADEAEATVMSEEALVKQYAGLLGVPESEVVVVSAKIEAELAALTPLEQKNYLASIGFLESGLERLIKTAYQKLGLISFLTAGEKEVRAWTLRAGMNALQAAGVIHTDFMQHFIKADVVLFIDFVESGGWKNAREKGLVRSEGRDYVLHDGEVVEFRIGT